MNRKKRVQCICVACGGTFLVEAKRYREIVKSTGKPPKLCNRWCNGIPRVLARV